MQTLLISGSTETEYVVSNPGTYKVVIDYGNGCTAEDNIQIEYVDFSSINNQTLSECDADDDGLSTFNLNLANSDLTNNNQNLIVSDFFLDQSDAENDINRIQNPENFQNTTPNQIIFARIENQAGCYIVVSLTLETSSSVFNSVSLVECAETPTSLVSYNLQAASMAIETEIGSQVQGITFYTSIEYAISQQNSIENSQEISAENLPETVYARAGTNSCQGIVPVVLKSVLSPQIDLEQTTQGFCENDEEIIISAGTKNNSDSYSYLWENGSTSSTLSVTEKGDYKVEITATEIIDGVTYNCSITNTITVVESGKAKIDHKLLGELGNFSVEILAKGIGDYVYAIDELPFQKNNIFTIKAGTHTLYIKDLNGCGIVSKKISVVDYMRFFTPNNDGYNDTWKLIGANREKPGS
ncbi:hypothetical protein ACFSO9_06540 [Mesonia maritima]|uniref:hypothetical protein n=1 Tax=Mesonia maritima TaxID=1793873 RepID=UPI0036432818